MIGDEARPRLAPKARLRPDRQTGRMFLLYPEAGLALNATGADILERCDGERTVRGIVDELLERYRDKPREVIDAEVRTFLEALAQRGLVVTAT